MGVILAVCGTCNHAMNAKDLPDFAAMTRREIEDYLVERAMVHPQFREQLLARPAQTLRELGLPVGKDVHIRIIEEEPKSFCLVLPRLLNDPEEADNTDLDHTVGGAAESPEMFRFFRGYA